MLTANWTKWRLSRQDRQWEKSGRKREIDAERDLPPRSLTVEEMELLRAALERGAFEAKSFLPQMDHLRAVRSCTCGCPSIQLHVADDAPRGDFKADRIIADLLGRTSKGELVGILVFQHAGYLAELEIYALDAGLDGESPEFGFPLVKSLQESHPGEPRETH